MFANIYIMRKSFGGEVDMGCLSAIKVSNSKNHLYYKVKLGDGPKRFFQAGTRFEFFFQVFQFPDVTNSDCYSPKDCI